LVRKRIENVARVLGIDSLLDRFPAQMSGGEQQRVALGRGLVQQAAVLLLDEPFAHLDGVLRRELREQVRTQQLELGTTTMLVTHDPAEAFAMSDRMAVIQEGRLLQVGSPQEIYDSPNSPAVARWGGPLGMNVWRGLVHEKKGSLWFALGSWEMQLPTELTPRVKPADEVLLGVRPEQLSLRPRRELGAATVRSAVFVGDGWLVQVVLEQGELATVRVPREETVPTAGERIKLYVAEADCHWFSVSSGRRLN
jgi:ABC-type sugar transport system ATPase subunit